MDHIECTAFPRLDTDVDVSSSRTATSTEDHPHYETVEHAYGGDLLRRPRSKEGLLKGYALFIAAVTGEAEVSFSFANRTSLIGLPNYYLVEASVSDPIAGQEPDNTHLPCELSISPLEARNGVSGFGIELIVDPDSFDFPNTPASLNSVS